MIASISNTAARKRMRRQVKKLGDRAQNALADAEHQVHGTGAAIEDRIRERPLQSALLALGLGIAFSKLFLGRAR